MDDNFPENVGTAEVPPSAPETAPKKVIGRPITKETAKQYAISAAKAKKLRKETRHRLLAALAASDVDLAEELKKAVRDADESRMSVVERALKCVGLHFDQSDEGRIQNLHVESKAEVHSNVVGGIQVEFTEATKPEG